MIDCEGLNGDNEPLANSLTVPNVEYPRGNSVSQAARAVVQYPMSRFTNHSTPKEPSQPVSSISMPWAIRLAQPINTAVVDKIYPRFLYVFSDVICYVTGNLR
jgi:hypothetical protein